MAIIPDLNQIAVVMSRLQHNYSQLAKNWFDIFYNPTPMDVTVTFFDELGQLDTFKLKNRAKDFQNVLSGEGEPEGSVPANVGVVYQDLLNGDVYVKKSGNGNTGWLMLMPSSELANFLKRGSYNPEGNETGPVGMLFIDTTVNPSTGTGGLIYIKTTPTGNTGWVQAISADYASKTYVHEYVLEKTGDLNNLSTTNKDNLVSAVNEINSKDFLPPQTGMDGKYLTTDGTSASWALASSYHPPILSCMWSDHILNDIQWLRANTFSWQSGTLYSTAYNHLVEDIKDKSLLTETLFGITINFYLADDGHKICPASQENNVLSLYNNTGVAWYYILDTTNTRFKLPRVKHKYITDKEIPVKGNGMTVGWTNGTLNFGSYKSTNSAYPRFCLNSRDYGKSIGESAPDSTTSEGNDTTIGLTTDPTKSGIVADTTDAIEETGFYLYFYVGEFSQTAIEQTAGITAEQLNTKADKNEIWTPTTATQTEKEKIINWAMPDLSAGILKTWGTTWTAPSNGWVYAFAGSRGGYAMPYVTINEIDFGVSQNGITSENISASIMMFVSKDDIIKSRDGSWGQNIVFYPCKGVTI